MRTTLPLLMLLNGVLMASPADRKALPLFFIPNEGQAPPPVRFLAKGSGLTAYFAPKETVFRLASATVRVEFAGAITAAMTGEDALAAHANFLREGQSRTGVPLYATLLYRGVYDGIDMVYGGDGRKLKSEFRVAPGADAGLIRVR